MRTAKPIPDHPYHLKSDSQLAYIIADAREAAVAMRGVDEKAEAKYLDQINDACTVRHYRRTIGDRLMQKRAAAQKKED